MLKVGVREIQSNLLVDGLRIMLSVYNRFENRKDLGADYNWMFGRNDIHDATIL